MREFWIPLEHACGCTIDWGCNATRQTELVNFLPFMVSLPCPFHGSATGVPADSIPEDGKTFRRAVDDRGGGPTRLLATNGFLYRKAHDDLIVSGQRNRVLALEKICPRCRRRPVHPAGVSHGSSERFHICDTCGVNLILGDWRTNEEVRADELRDEQDKRGIK
jgi:hypothetical protein